MWEKIGPKTFTRIDDSIIFILSLRHSKSKHRKKGRKRIFSSIKKSLIRLSKKKVRNWWKFHSSSAKLRLYNGLVNGMEKSINFTLFRTKALFSLWKMIQLSSIFRTFCNSHQLVNRHFFTLSSRKHTLANFSVFHIQLQ